MAQFLCIYLVFMYLTRSACDQTLGSPTCRESRVPLSNIAQPCILTVNSSFVSYQVYGLYSTGLYFPPLKNGMIRFSVPNYDVWRYSSHF